ncbi:G8 domain-containing protein [Sorangium sp. So ce381]|uniref:G8 domain-containing protein n=1 Tax=Sorangium sp. So ce381 TaxID=3133307 RepID=UPI003F5C212D
MVRTRLALSLVAAAALAACGSSGNGPGGSGGPDGPTADCPDGESCSFCHATTWGGALPGADTDVVIPSGKVVVVDCPAEAHTVLVEAGGTLRASREASATLTLHGNLVVEGTVDYGTPDDRVPDGVTAEIVFTGMHDEDYAGTPSAVEGGDGPQSVDTPISVVGGDVGVWVMGAGRLLAAGAPKRAWGKLVEGAGDGDAVFTVDDASGWKAGDRVVLTPSTPLAGGDAAVDQFDEGTIAAVDGNEVTLAKAPAFTHDGCADCLRRAEAANLSRNVVIRSADDTAHAHILVAEQGHAQLDSVELRWLGPLIPCSGGAEGTALPARRAPLWFHQQKDASAGSFVRHAAIWGGELHFIMVEQSNDIEISDVAGYDTQGVGFGLFYDNGACGTFCDDREKAPAGVLLDHVLAARVGIPERVDGCIRVDHRMTGIAVSGGEGSGARDSVAVGVGYDGTGEDVSGFGWQEGGSGRPADFVFDGNVAHHVRGHGAMIWQNIEVAQPAYRDNAFWSNGHYGVLWGAYVNPLLFSDVVAVDNGLASIGVKAIPLDDTARMQGGTVDDIKILAYVFIQEKPAIFDHVTFTGDRPVAVTQLHEACDGGDEEDPADPDCLRVWLRFVDPVFPAGVLPFDFGQTFNRYSTWEVRGFSSPDFPDLPADFDLYRADNEVEGGAYFAPFDAWLVPR